MTDSVAPVTTEGLLGHPAVLAWRQLGAGHAASRSVQTLKEQRKPSVYRLRGARPDWSSVIAKRCWSDRAVLEHTIYTEALPQLPVSALRCHGLGIDVVRRGLRPRGVQRHYVPRHEGFAPQMLYRLLASISWEARWLAYERVRKPISNLRLFSRRLSQSIQEVETLSGSRL